MSTASEFLRSHSNKRELGFFGLLQIAAPLKISELGKKSRECVGEVYERAASKCYGYTSSQGNDVSFHCHSAAFSALHCFRGAAEQEYLGCRPPPPMPVTVVKVQPADVSLDQANGLERWTVT